MQVVINVSDDQFDSIVKDQLGAISPEDLHEALVKAINDYFTTHPQAIERLLFPYNSYDRYQEPTQLLRDMVKSCDFSGLQPVVDDCIKLVSENKESILRNIIFNQMVETLMNTYYFRDQLKSALTCEVMNAINSRNNQ